MMSCFERVTILKENSPPKIKKLVCRWNFWSYRLFCSFSFYGRNNASAVYFTDKLCISLSSHTSKSTNQTDRDLLQIMSVHWLCVQTYRLWSTWVACINPLYVAMLLL